MNKLYFQFKAVALILALLFVLNSCSYNVSEIELWASDIDYSAVDEEFDQAVKNTFGYYLAYQNDAASLYINSITTEIKVVDKATGREWYSNPTDRKNDPLAVSPDNPINSTLIFRYMHGGSGSDFNPEVSASLATYNSWTDSVEKGQYSFSRINNGIRVNYGVGIKQAQYLVPTILSTERFEELKSKLDEQGQYMLDSNYYYITLSKYNDNPLVKALFETKIPILKKRDVYLLAPLAQLEAGVEAPIDYTAQQLEPIFKSIGYTQDDLDRDNAENLVEKEKSTNVYFELSVEYMLDGSDLVVNIPKDSIKYDDSIFHLMQVNVLPFFGAAGKDKTGYIFVPDGSGALIRINSERTDLPTYSKQVYGSDVNLQTKDLDDSQIYLPVFGLKQNDDAFLAIIEEGDASSIISADISGRTSNYNTVSATFTLKNSGQAHSTLLARSHGITYYQQRTLQSNLKIRYKFLHDDNANYTGMALAYQKYLLDNHLIEKQQFQDKIPLYIEALGAISYNSLFLGIPYESRLPLTKYKQAEEILKTLRQKGIENIEFQYSYWCNDGAKNTLNDRADLIRQLGSKKDFLSLVSYIKENQIGYYPEVNFAYITENTMFKLFSKSSLASRYVDNTVMPLNIVSKSIPKSESSVLAITPRYYESLVGKFIKSYQKYDIGGLSINSFGTDLGGDYNKNNVVDREMCADIIAEQLKRLQKEHNLSIKGANAFTLKYANTVNNIPSSSGNNYLFECSVPFYQIVLHGIVPYSSEPINLSSDYKKAALRLLESGTIPSFQWMYAENSVLRDTSADFYGVHYKYWLDQAVNLYNEINEVLADCQTSQIVSHQIIEPGFTATRYSNRVTIYVNYNDYPVKYNDIAVDSLSFKAVRG